MHTAIGLAIIVLVVAACNAQPEQGRGLEQLDSLQPNVEQAQATVNGETFDLGPVRADWSLIVPSDPLECDESYMLYLPHVAPSGTDAVHGSIEVPMGFTTGVTAHLPGDRPSFILSLGGSYDGLLLGGVASWNAGARHELHLTDADFCDQGLESCETVDVIISFGAAPADATSCVIGVDAGNTDSNGGIPCGRATASTEELAVESMCPATFAGTP